MKPILLLLLIPPLFGEGGEKTRWLEAAEKAALWIDSTRVTHSDDTWFWPPTPDKPEKKDTGLYAGTAGVVFFLTRLYQATGDNRWLESARGGADYLCSRTQSSPWPNGVGLYAGWPGTAFVLAEFYRVDQSTEYRNGAVRLLDRITTRLGNPPQFDNLGKTTDIINGYAGLGLAMLYFHEQGFYPRSLELARSAGDKLIAGAVRRNDQTYWMVAENSNFNLPNFSHGTAGNAYFLARLFEETGNKTYLDGALAGARYLLSISSEKGYVGHSLPDWQDRFYLGWCHGPPGTSRLYYQLWKVTGDEVWHKPVLKAFDSLVSEQLHQRRTAGFWNNVSQCCGSAGVASCSIDLYQAYNRKDYLEYAYKLAEDILKRSTKESNGLKWVQAEHRIKPELLDAQTGFMQGAAGIGFFLLQLDAYERGLKLDFRLPDNPF